MRLKKIDNINIVPFVDIVLVLLIMVILSATFIDKSKIKINTPTINQNIVDSKREKVKKIIHIANNNKIFIDNKEIKIVDINKWIANNLNSKDIISIDSDKESNYNTFVKVFSSLKNNNITNINIYVKKDK